MAVAGVWRPSPAAAQLSRVGTSKGVVTTPTIVRGTDVAYDPSHGVYLVVGAQGVVRGGFTDANGDIVAGTSQFAIGNANGTDGAFAAYPRVAFSADANSGQGGFLVSWHQYNGSKNVVHVAIVAYPTGQITNAVAVSDQALGGSWWEAGAPIAYSATSKKFLVAWQTFVTFQIQGRFVGNDGSPTGSVMIIETKEARDPGLAWNAATDEFGLSMSGFNNSGAFSAFRRIAASTGALSARTTFAFAAASFITDITVNPSTRHYVMGWSNGGTANYAEIDETGNVLATGALGVGTYDALGIAYNVASGSILAVGQGNSTEVLGRELNGQGVPIGSLQTLTNGGGTKGSFYPRTTARTDAKQWNISYSRQFLTGADQIIQTGTSLAGPVSNVQMNLESPTGGTFRTSDTITLIGWAVDRGASSGPGIDAVHAWAFPQGGGAGIFFGGVTSFSARGDVGGLLGTQFVNSGFTVSGTGLPVGTYTLNVYPRSTVTGKFGTPKSVTVTIASALPMMNLDAPANNATVSTTFAVHGWALDKFAPSDAGTGVVAVHVWAFPSSGPPRFVGAASLGASRTDVGAVFGAQFNNSGFTLTGTLPAGTYRLVAYLYDALKNDWALSQTASITVTGPVSSPAGSVDAPVPNSTVALGSNLGGWAIDGGDTNSTGVDAVHVWAFPVSGGAVFVGAATLGFSRPDVGAAFGSQFSTAGYNLTLAGLTSGQTYDLAVYARSTLTGNFNQIRVVRVTIQ